MAKNAGVSFTKWLIIIVVLGVVAAGGYKYWKSKQNAGPTYRTAAVTRNDLVQSVTATGQLNPITNVQVGCQISGIISKLNVDYNSPVKKGQVIAQVDPASYKAIVVQCQGDLTNSLASMELAQIQAKRADALFKAQLISESDHDIAVATLHQAQATVMMKQATLDAAQVNLNYTTIYSPVDGTVISRNVDVGQTVAASFNAPILYQIANDLSKMQIDALVSEADIGGITTNQVVNFTVDAYPTRTFVGTVYQVRDAPITNQNVITYDTVVSVDNSDLKLKPGMTANVSIITAQRTNVLSVPNAALRFHPQDTTNSSLSGVAGVSSNASYQMAGTTGTNHLAGGGRHLGHTPPHTVYVLVNDPGGDKGPTLKSVQVKTGINDGASTEVRDGLNEGDLVVIGQIMSADSPSGPSNPFNTRRF